MKKNGKRLFSLLLAFVMCLSLTMTAFARQREETDRLTDENSQQEEEQINIEPEGEEQEDMDGEEEPEEEEPEENGESDSGEEEPKQNAPVNGEETQDPVSDEKEAVKGNVQTDAQDDNVVVKKGDKPYLALGADLTAEQQAAVLSLMGISQADLANYDVVYVTNEMEHQYLDSYLPSSTIGTKALSSVLIMEGKKGSGIQISIKNISYCTVGMYKNALATAGLEDAEIIVAGPFPISGTAALIGALNAYAEMTGDEVKEESLDAAMNELVVTGQLADAAGGTEQAEELMAYLKREVVKNGLDDEKGIREAIEKGSEEFGITLTEDQKNELMELLLKISKLDLDWDQLLNQASDLYDRLEDLSGSGIGAKIKSFFQAIADFFRNLFS